jgi:predicted RNA-binding Zn ribbon-like protein
MAGAAPSYRQQPPKRIGGLLCLDFVNTVSWRGDPEQPGERLTGYVELLHWSRHAGFLDAAGLRSLALAAKRRPGGAAAAVASAVRLREAFVRLLERGRGAAAGLRTVNDELAAAPPRSVLEARGAGFAWRDGARDHGLLALLHPVLWSMADLLTSGRLARARRCGDARCGWWFLDSSPAGRRRWCSMQACGNRAKVRRHYAAGRSSARGGAR